MMRPIRRLTGRLILVACFPLNMQVQWNCKVLLLIERMSRDWDRVPLKKPWGWKDTNSLHSRCGLYLYFRSLLKSTVSDADFAREEPKLRDQFLQGYLDADIEHALLHSAPPGDLKSIGVLRSGPVCVSEACFDVNRNFLVYIFV